MEGKRTDLRDRILVLITHGASVGILTVLLVFVELEWLWGFETL